MPPCGLYSVSDLREWDEQVTAPQLNLQLRVAGSWVLFCVVFLFISADKLLIEQTHVDWQAVGYGELK